ncbi:MAG: D-Ala-D-Ala carboxypeptidase family metallohydrolase [Ferribacterium limneticum]
MKLSKYFTLDELTFSQTAARIGIDNTPSMEMANQLGLTAYHMDKVRELLGHPVIVSSGYRSPELNAAVRGSATSSHVRGEAVDFTCPGYGSVREVFDAIRESDICFDQLIVEFGRWVHIGFDARMRGQCLAYNGNGYKEIA